MRALALVVALSSVSAFADYAAMAIWTGNSKYVTTVTFKTVLACEYDYLGTRFWRTTRGFSCPYQVEVE